MAKVGARDLGLNFLKLSVIFNLIVCYHQKKYYVSIMEIKINQIPNLCHLESIVHKGSEKLIIKAAFLDKIPETQKILMPRNKKSIF